LVFYAHLTVPIPSKKSAAIHNAETMSKFQDESSVDVQDDVRDDGWWVSGMMSLSANSAHRKPAMSMDDGKSWELNWKITMTRAQRAKPHQD